MKRLLCLLLALVLTFAVVGCTPADKGNTNETTGYTETDKSPDETKNDGNKPIDEITALQKKQEYISESGGLFGVSYLGFYENKNEKLSDFVKRQKYYEAMDFLNEVSENSFVNGEGNELYVIVPLPDVKLTVYENELDETTYENKKGKVVYTSEIGAPFYLAGNVSDIIPSFIIVAEGQSGTVEYSPCLSLKDGRLSTFTEGVTDITPYKYMGDFIYGIEDSFSDYTVSVTQELAAAVIGQNYLTPKNVILLIGDGMGPNDIEIAEKYGQGVNNYGLLLNMLTSCGYATTYSADNEVTDSAASATALATGVKTNNGYIGMTPDGGILKTVAELAREKGKRVGIVTDDYMYGATPSAFVVHNESRYNYSELAKGLLDFAPDVLIGESYAGFYNTMDDADRARFTGTYGIASRLEDFDRMMSECLQGAKKFAGFNGGCRDEVSSHLALSAETALRLLENENGFFLMIEGCGTDAYGHGNSIEGKMASVVNLDKTLEKILLFMKNNPDTLLIVTSDHETGGVALPQADAEPTDGLFTVTTHTSTSVRVFCLGDGSLYFKNKTVDNTDIAKFLINAIEGK